MKRWALLMVAVLAAAPMAHADDASKKAKVEELFATMHMERMMNQLTDAMVAQAKQTSEMMPGADQMTASQKKLVNQYQDKMVALVQQSVGWKALEPQYVTLYASTYSEDEIEGILTFYKSPAGQAMLAKTPDLTKGSMQLVQSRMGDLEPKMKALIDEMVKQMSATAPPSGATVKPKN